jgi:hypothetical protein
MSEDGARKSDRPCRPGLIKRVLGEGGGLGVGMRRVLGIEHGSWMDPVRPRTGASAIRGHPQLAIAPLCLTPSCLTPRSDLYGEHAPTNI